jgi:hypothetical protein
MVLANCAWPYMPPETARIMNNPYNLLIPMTSFKLFRLLWTQFGQSERRGCQNHVKEL